MMLRLSPFSNGIEARHIPRFSKTNGMLGSPLIMWWIGLIETLPQTAIWIYMEKSMVSGLDFQPIH